MATLHVNQIAAGITIAAFNKLTPTALMFFTNDWSEANAVVFNEVDQKGVKHRFADVESGMYLDVFNTSDAGFMVALLGERAPNAPDGRIAFFITPDRHLLKPEGLAAIKVFSIDDSVDPGELANFVRKSGDTMTGKLTIEKPIWIRPQGSPTGGWGANSMLIVNQQGASTDSIVRIKQNGKDRLKIKYDGNTSLENNKLVSVAGPEDDMDGVNKLYVDEAIAEALANIHAEPAPAQLCWEYRKPLSGKAPSVGTFWLDNEHFRFSYKTQNGVDLGYIKPDARDEWYAPGARDDSGAFYMTIWVKYDEGWHMYDHVECSATR